jgi:hypothetical protein
MWTLKFAVKLRAGGRIVSIASAVWCTRHYILKKTRYVLHTEIIIISRVICPGNS